ncbi:MAG TPA: HAMP domain-containing sensor histidine kinase [Solirubrobacteraceae bacterium]|nr:HAMP domain-containing sensor histidine kinase [Solirubrobacteraceae bacterium]
MSSWTPTRPAAHDAAEADRHFAAYAAHELRGEIALQRALAEVALGDPNAGRTTLREMGQRVVVACERQERLLAALLTLSRSRCGSLPREPVDLAATAAEVLRASDHHGLASTTAFEPAWTSGDPELLERLVVNLVTNAIRHNVAGGRFDIATDNAAGRAVLTIANTGPVIPPGELTRLFQPFERLGARRGSAADGAGLGLAIVQAIVSSHGASLAAQPRAGGGLRIDVAFPALE